MLDKFIVPVKNLIRVKNVKITNSAFKMQTKVSVILFMAFAMLISSKQYFGDPIHCKTSSETQNQKFVDSFCWTTGTYVDTKPLNGTIGTHFVYHGIGVGQVPDNRRSYQKYYQWIVPILILQAVFFYVPSYLWRIWEGGLMNDLCVKYTSPIIPDSWDAKSKKCVLQYLTENNSSHKAYAYRFIFCELLNYFIGILNIAFTNFLFTGFWTKFTPTIETLLTGEWSKWEAYSSRVFPKIAKCDWFYVGYSGTITKNDALCVLPLNVINEKIFAFLWIWYIVLFAISSINFIYRLLILCSSKYRIMVLQSQARPITFKQTKRASNGGNYGDWFVLWLMGLNLNHEIFKEIMFDLNESVSIKSV